MASAPPDDSAAEKTEPTQNPEENDLEIETENVVRGFLYTRLSNRVEQESQEGNLEVASIPQSVLRDLRGSITPPDSSASELGTTLAALGDEINSKYRDTFQEMITQLGLTPSTAYQSFAGVTRRLFENGINWGRIVALLCFGYEIAVSVIERGSQGAAAFLRRIVRYVVQFIITEKIGQWISANGGWTALLDLRRNNPDIWFKRAIFSFGIVLCCVLLAKTVTKHLK